MVTELECRAIYQQLVRMLQELRMGEVTRSVEKEWITLDALTEKELHLLLEEEDSQSLHTLSTKNKQRKPSTSEWVAAPLSLEFDEVKQSKPDRADAPSVPSDERFYPPQRRVLLLIKAIEQVLAQPTIQGLAVMDALGQDELLFKDTQHPEQDFTLSRSTLQKHAPDALALFNNLRSLAHYIDPTGEIEV